MTYYLPLGKNKKAIEPAEVERLAGTGLTVMQIAKELHISRRCLEQRMDNSETLTDAYERGKLAFRKEHPAKP